MILCDLEELGLLSANNVAELSRLLRSPLSASFSGNLRSQLASTFLSYPVLAVALCNILSTRCQQVGNMELSRALWTPLVAQILGDKFAQEGDFQTSSLPGSQEVSQHSNHEFSVDNGPRFDLLQYLTFSAHNEPPNATSTFSALVSLYFTPSVTASYAQRFGNPIRQKIYSSLLALPDGPQAYALQLYSSIEEAAIRRECERVSSTLAWPFEVLRPITISSELESIDNSASPRHGETEGRLEEFWAQYFDFVTISKNHFIEYVITQFFDLINERRFEDCRVLLLPFHQLKPLLLLMCFEKFGDDIKPKQEILDMLWNTKGEHRTRNDAKRSPHGEALKNQNLEDAVNAISYQVKLARWAGSLLLKQHQEMIENGDTSSSLVIGNQQIGTPENGADSVIANLVSNMLKQHGILFILHHYLHNIELEELESIVKQTPISADETTANFQNAQLQTDLTLLYCYLVLKEVVGQIQLASEGQLEVDSLAFERIERVLAKIDSPSVLLALLETIFNFLFMRSDAWKNPGVRALSTAAHRGSAEIPEFIVGQKLSFSIVNTISKSLSSLRSMMQEQECSSLEVAHLDTFEKKLKEVFWRLNLISKNHYFLVPLLSLDGEVGRTSSNESFETPKPISIVSVLVAKPESLLIRSIRERDFKVAHELIDFFNMKRNIDLQDDHVDVDGISMGASHLAEVSELVFLIRRDLTAGKAIPDIIDPILKRCSDSPSSKKLENLEQNTSDSQSSSDDLLSSSSPSISKLEVFFLLCDMTMTSNLPSEQTSKLLEIAQTLCDEIQSKLSKDDAEHFIDYMDRLKTLDKAESLSEALPTLRAGVESVESPMNRGSSIPNVRDSISSTTQSNNLSANTTSMSWIPNGLNARLLALESWPTECDALGGYLQLRSRLLGAATKLRAIVSQSAVSREKGFSSPVGLDSEDTLRKLTLFLSVDDWSSSSGATPGSPKNLRTPSKSTATTPLPIAQQSSSSSYKTPIGAATSPASPSTNARNAFNSLGDGFLQSFLRQLLMIGISLRDDARLGKTDFFEHLHAAPKHLLAELVYGSRNYGMAESIASELELDLVSLILELMGTVKPCAMQRCSHGAASGDASSLHSSNIGSSASPTSLHGSSSASHSSSPSSSSQLMGPNSSKHLGGKKNSGSNTSSSDLALDYMPSSVNYGASLSYEYGMNPSAATTNSSNAGSDEDKYTLHLNLVEYLKAHSPLVATLACILRAPSDKYDERFLSYAFASTKKHFAPLHLWLRVKIRQFGVFYNTTLRDHPEEVSFPIGSQFVQHSKASQKINITNASGGNGGGNQMGDISGTSVSSLTSSSNFVPAVSTSHTSQHSMGHSLNQQSGIPMQKWHANRSNAVSFSASSSFDPAFSSMGSGIGLGGGNASPTSSMNELGIDGSLANNPMLAARASSNRNASQGRMMSSSTHILRGDSSSRFSDDEGDGEHDRPISRSRRDDEDAISTGNGSSTFNSSVGNSSAVRIGGASGKNNTSNHSAASSLTSRPELSMPNQENDVGEDKLQSKFPTIDILDHTEAQIFETIFQNETLQSEVVMYLKAVDKLEKSGQLQKALQLADSALPMGAPDSLLIKLVESTSDKQAASEYILRMRNKTKAATLALTLVPHWEIPTIMQVLFMCECHLTRDIKILEEDAEGTKNNQQEKIEAEAALEKVRDMYERVQRYSEILDVVKKDDVQSRWKSWLELDELARKDLAVVVQLLLSGGHYDIARRLTEHFKHTFLKLRVEEKYLLHLLELGDTRGVRMRLRSLEGEEAVRIAQSLMDLVTTNNDRLFLTQFILERKAQQQKLLLELTGHSPSSGDPNSSSSASGDLTSLTATELGLKILLCLPPELQKVFQPLMSSPFVIIESLLVSEQTLVLNKLFKEIPQVHDDQLVLKYARKALDATRLFSAADAVLLSRSPSSSSLKNDGASNITPSSTAPTSRAVSDDENSAPQTIGYYADPSESHGGSSHMTGGASYAMLSKYGMNQAVGVGGGSVGGANQSGAKKLYLADEKKEHVYLSAPNYPLAAGIFDLCRNANLVAAACIEVCDQLSTRLHSIKDRLFVVRIIQQLLYYAKLRLMTSDFSTLDLVQTCDMLLQRTELLLQLIFCGGTATASAIAELSKSLSLSMLADPQKARSLRERLVENDLLDLALLVATKCGVETDPVWAAKALRMLETNRYQEAKQLFRYCLVSVYPEEAGEGEIPSVIPNRSSGGLGSSSTKTVADNSLLLSKILLILETNVPIEVDKLAQRRDYLSALVRPPNSASALLQKDSALWHKRFKNMEDIDDGDAAVKSLEQMRKFPSGGVSGASQSPNAPPPSVVRRHTLDSIRYMQCVYYLQRFGSEEMIIKFWLRHDLLEDCLRHMDSKPPPYDTKLLLLVVNHALSRNIFPRFREALYKIDKDVERWRDAMLALCVHFHRASMPTVLLELQVCMKDYSRAGLTSMTIYNTQTDPLARVYYLELVQKYLTIALESYEEILAVQQKSTSSTARLPLTKVDIAKHIKTAGLQARLIEFSLTLEPSKSNPNPDLLPDDASLWGNSASKQQITEFLIVNHNFDLAFKIIQEYRLPSEKIYRDAIVKMAKKKQTKKIEELLKSLKIVLSGKDIDTCHVAVARVYGMVHNDFSVAESFAAKVVDQAQACEALIACRKLKQAYLIAAKLKDLDLVRAIQAEAKRLDMKREYELCDTFLKSYDETYK